MAGFFKYLRFIIRRERLISSLWIASTVILTFLIALIFPSLLNDDASKNAMLEMLKSPTMVGMLGAFYDTSNYTVAMVFSQMMTVWIMISLAVMNIFFVNRHTRLDEEQGRLEMLRSLPIGKLTNNLAVIFSAFILNFIIAVLTFLSLMIANLEGCTFSGAISYSFTLAVVGFVIASITLLCSQLFSTLRASSGVAFVVLGVFYLMRLAGDYTNNPISYISPLGLGIRVFPFYENNIYPIIILLIESALFILASLVFCVNRDLGEGLIPAKKGRANAKNSLLSPLGFALRLTKSFCIVWCFVIFIIASMYGTLLKDLESFVQSNDFYRQLLQLDSNVADNLMQSFISVLYMVMAHISAIPVILVASKLRHEESRGRLEQIFARSINRKNMLIIFVVIAFIESILTMLFTSLGIYFASLGSVSIKFGTLFKTGLCYLPALWVFMSMSVLLTGVFHRGGAIVWLIYAYSFIALYLGGLLNIPKILQRFSPFGNVPQIQEFKIFPIIISTLIASIFTTLGVWRFSKRDIG